MRIPPGGLVVIRDGDEPFDHVLDQFAGTFGHSMIEHASRHRSGEGFPARA
jgi:hypothetical protein